MSRPQPPQDPVVILDDDGVDVPDDVDIELVREPDPQSTLAPVDQAARKFRSGGISPVWVTNSQEPPPSNIKVGDIVHLAGLGGYLQIMEFYNDLKDDTFVFRGVRYVLLTDMFPGLEGDENEVIVIQDVYKDSVKNRRGLYLENFRWTDLKHPVRRIPIRLTNQLRRVHYQRGRLTDYLPHHNFLQLPPGQLICRSKYTVYYDVPCSHPKPRKTEEVWSNLHDYEADPDLRVDDRLLRHQGREARGRGSDMATHEITACDCFCGAGFASVGANASGMTVTMAFDADAKAMGTYRRNHRHVRRAMRMTFDEVLRRYGYRTDEQGYRIDARGNRIPEHKFRINTDVLLMSFPCQFFSPAHTRPGKNDDANEVLMFGLGDFLAQTKPRIVVIEQTFGLHHGRFRQHLMKVIAGFRNNDYSIRKAVINFAGLGEASQRRRLIFIAAAPGEKLPPLPEQIFNTNFSRTDPDLLPAVSIWDRLQLVIGNASDHAPYKRLLSTRTRPYDPRVTKLGTIVCGRGSRDSHNRHWSGKRLWTPHELKILQGAPPTYRFSRKLRVTDMWRQIGNAFPCLAAEQIYRRVVESLKRTDAEDNADNGAADTLFGSSPATAILVSDNVSRVEVEDTEWESDEDIDENENQNENGRSWGVPDWITLDTDE